MIMIMHNLVLKLRLACLRPVDNSVYPGANSSLALGATIRGDLCHTFGGSCGDSGLIPDLAASGACSAPCSESPPWCFTLLSRLVPLAIDFVQVDRSRASRAVAGFAQ
jgi:hypothetical protein